MSRTGTAPLAKELKAGHAGSAGTELGGPLVKGIKHCMQDHIFLDEYVNNL